MPEIETKRPYRERFLDNFDRSQLRREVEAVRPRRRFHGGLPSCSPRHSRHDEVMQLVTDQIRNFLQYIAVQFIEFPAEAQLKVTELGPKRLRFKLVLRQSDVALLIGRNGFSASAIRGVLKSIAKDNSGLFRLVNEADL